jgi:serine phosphatase RsbU (regulator of sigma subunit)
MNDRLEPGLAGYEQAKLRSERIRILAMMGLYGAFALIGIFRILVPVSGLPVIGWAVAILSAAYFAGEALMLHLANRALRQGRPWNGKVGIAQAFFECGYPIGLMYLLMHLSPADRFAILVSPAYPFLLVLIAVSVLCVDWRVTALTGLGATIGYAALVTAALNWTDSTVQSPHPPMMYGFLTVMLALATVAAVFVSIQVRGYVDAAVREMEVRRQRDRLQRDLQIASQIQQRLLPQTMPELPGYEIAAISRPADETGGDYYDWQQVSRTRTVFSLGDVTGHGIGPALVTAACRAYVRAALGSEPVPATVLERVNGLLHADLTEGRFVTLALVDIDAESHQTRLLSAGHGPTLHVRGRDGEVTTMGSQGLPLGLFDESMLEDSVKFCLERGDLVVLCSDGFFEPANASGEEFGMERLCQFVREHRDDTPERLLAGLEAAVREFMGQHSQLDDMTALIIKRVR